MLDNFFIFEEKSLSIVKFNVRKWEIFECFLYFFENISLFWQEMGDEEVC